MTKNPRINFFVDGFNVYYSLRPQYKWLNLHQLCLHYIPEIDSQGKLGQIYYFSALFPNKPHGLVRHENYIKCLKSQRIKVNLGNFSCQIKTCKKCKTIKRVYEEKSTDVNLAVEVITSFAKKECDIAVIISGDTDFINLPAKIQKVFGKKVIFLFPVNRESLRMSYHPRIKSIQITEQVYKKCQFDETVKISNSENIKKPVIYNENINP